MNLDLCKNCKHYEFDWQKGVLCSLTHAKPDFVDQCPDYVLDANRPELTIKKMKKKSLFNLKTESHELPDMDEYLKKWGIGLNILGFFYLIVGGASTKIFGFLLIALGIFNFIFRKKEMVLIDGCVVLAVGFLNAVTGIIGKNYFFVIFGTLQLIWGCMEVFKFINFNKYENQGKDISKPQIDSNISGTQFQNRHSNLGIISIIAFAMICLFQFINLIVISVLTNGAPHMLKKYPQAALFAGVITFGCYLLCLIGLFVGIMGLKQKDRQKILPALGVVLNSLAIIYFILLNIISLFFIKGA